MRVIAGKYRSRKLTAPAGMAIRPTSDRLRETLFDVVAAGVDGSTWIDLFAGTGAIGIEALSRGATMVHFVESSLRAVHAIRRNLSELGIQSGYQILERDAAVALRVLGQRGVVCDFCFLDPPYRRRDNYEKILTLLAASPLLKVGAQVIAEHEKHFDPGEDFGALHRDRKLRQGDAVLSFYRLSSQRNVTTEDTEEHREMC